MWSGKSGLLKGFTKFVAEQTFRYLWPVFPFSVCLVNCNLSLKLYPHSCNFSGTYDTSLQSSCDVKYCNHIIMFNNELDNSTIIV